MTTTPQHAALWSKSEVSPKLQTVSDIAADPDVPLTEPALRFKIFNAKSNGLAQAGAIVRCGRRVYIDRAAFDRWLLGGADGSGGAANDHA